MARSANTAKSPAATKTSRPVTLKHLAAMLAEEHQLTKRAGEALLGGLVALITKDLKNGERIRIACRAILQVSAPLAGAILQFEKQSRSKPAESRLPSGQGTEDGGSMLQGAPHCPADRVGGAVFIADSTQGCCPTCRDQ
jgi:hypothetical protein